MKKVVVVDDDPEMRSLMQEVLASGYQVKTAGDGAEGLELIRRERPDLVVLDILMPRMHGFEVCQRLRQDEALKATKVLISSSKSYLHDQQTALEAGADGYIVKPFEVSAFLTQVDEMLDGRRLPLKLTFWGTRGSIPAPGPKTQAFGGNTPCVELRAGKQLLIVDAGTGLRELGQALLQESSGKPLKASLFIGHTHWDHIQGLPFFTPAYMPQNRFDVYGVHGTTQDFAQVLSGQMSPAYFPVSMKDMLARVEVKELNAPVELEGVKVSYHYLNHPGITVGFRFETRHWSVCYLSDHEPYGKLNNKGEFSAKEDAAVARFVAGCDLLISEAQYTEEEYKFKKSWGHSTFHDVLGLAAASSVKKLALFHHDPLHTDDMMARYEDECRAHASRMGYSFEVFGAREGMSLSL